MENIDEFICFGDINPPVVVHDHIPDFDIIMAEKALQEEIGLQRLTKRGRVHMTPEEKKEAKRLENQRNKERHKERNVQKKAQVIAHLESLHKIINDHETIDVDELNPVLLEAIRLINEITHY
jgi:membrane glycosyltransferase